MLWLYSPLYKTPHTQIRELPHRLSAEVILAFLTQTWDTYLCIRIKLSTSAYTYYTLYFPLRNYSLPNGALTQWLWKLSGCERWIKKIYGETNLVREEWLPGQNTAGRVWRETPAQQDVIGSDANRVSRAITTRCHQDANRCEVKWQRNWCVSNTIYEVMA